MASKFPLEVESVLGAEEKEGAHPWLGEVRTWDPLLLKDTAL